MEVIEISNYERNKVKNPSLAEKQMTIGEMGKTKAIDIQIQTKIKKKTIDNRALSFITLSGRWPKLYF